MATCPIPDCDRPSRKPGVRRTPSGAWCETHYWRWRKYRDPDHEPPARRLSRNPLYARWAAMIARCTHPSSTGWELYGGRGITVCERWRGPGGFLRWLEDMGPPPAGMSLDRIDPDGDYEPSNCRWATPTEQNRNQRRSVRRNQAAIQLRRRIAELTAQGMTGAQVAAQCGTTPGYVYKLRTHARRAEDSGARIRESAPEAP